MNRSWGYHRLDFSWKPFAQLLDRLITNAHHGGAMTLNVGALGNGSFPQAARRRLREFAAWMQANESAVQPTRPSPFPEAGLPAGVRATAGPVGQPPHVNLFLLSPRPEGQLIVPRPPDFGDSAARFHAEVLETHQMLDVNPAGDHRLVIDIPSTLAAIDHAVIRVGPASSLPALHEDGQAVERVKPGRFHG